MKTLIILMLLLLGTNLSADEWVNKHRIKNENISTLQYLDSSNCYPFVDNSGECKTRIYHSSNLGDSWQILYNYEYIPYIDTIYGINHCTIVDTNNIFMTYTLDFALDKSSDGGKTFSRVVFEAEDRELIGATIEFEMYDKNIGIICGSNDFFITKDGWETYKILPLGDYYKVGRPMFFVDSNNVVLLKWHANSHEFMKFTIDTETWSEYSVGEETPEGEKPKVIYDISFVNDTLGFACGGQKYGAGMNSSDIIWKTIDKGRHWKIIHEKTIPITNAATKISFSDELHGMAVGSWGKIYQTTDGGKNWIYHENLPDGLESTIGVKVLMAKEYPIVTSLEGGIFRYEEPVSVNESEFKDANFEIKQTPERLTINVTDENHRKYKLQIVDIQGKSMYDGSLLYSLENLVSLSGFSSGVYVYRIMCEGVLARSGKIVISR